MPLRAWCCCCAMDAVVVDTRSPPEAIAIVERPSLASTPLVFMDAVENESDLPTSLVDLKRMSSADDVFYDAELAPPSEDEQKDSVKLPLRTPRLVAFEEEKKTPEKEEEWDSRVLHEYEDKDLLAHEYRDGSISTSGRHRRRMNPDEMGFPGYLKPDQLKALQVLREAIKRKGKHSIYYEMMYAYIDLEPEPYALCRYLRLYHFNVKKVFQHMDKSADLWTEARKHDFYPTIADAVHAPASVLLTQFPSLYYGLSKKGYPCCYFNAGALSAEGIECVTDASNLANFIWHTMMHDMKKNKFPEAKKRHPDFIRLEQITILNLKGLSRSIFTPKVYNAIQQVDSAAAVFPEMLHSLVIVNAPGFFSFIWSIISRFIDPKTKSLIEIYSSSEKGKARLLELIDERQLPRDYGGRAPATSEIILREGRTGGLPNRQIVELLHVGREERFDFVLGAHERVELSIYTRCKSKYDFLLMNVHGRLLQKETINSLPPPSVPSCFEFRGSVDGPGKFALIARAQHQSGRHHFLVIGEVFPVEDS